MLKDVSLRDTKLRGNVFTIGVGILLAILMAVTIVFAFPNKAQAVWTSPESIYIYITPGYDCMSGRNESYMGFAANNTGNWVGQGWSNRKDQVAAVQAILKAEHGRTGVGTTDGLYGPNTAAGISWYQDNVNEIITTWGLNGGKLTKDGIFGTKCWHGMGYLSAYKTYKLK